MLKIENLSVNYGHISALRNISLEVNGGEVVAIIGANGAGKSTTLMSISGLVEKASGKITFLGKDITHAKPNHIVRMGISHIPEGRRIFSEMSVEENMFMGTFGAEKKLSRKVYEEKLEEMYTFFPRLKERRKQAGGTLSGGEQQMLAIARGLMYGPKLIMFDEPSLGLAPILVEEVFNYLKVVKKAGTTMLLIEQNATAALEIADRAYVLETGEIKLSGTGQEVMVNPQVKEAYLGI